MTLSISLTFFFFFSIKIQAKKKKKPKTKYQDSEQPEINRLDKLVYPLGFLLLCKRVINTFYPAKFAKF